MSISSVSATNSLPHMLQSAKTPEAVEGPGPDHDGDSDDKGIGTVSSAPSAVPPAGMGRAVDAKA